MVDALQERRRTITLTNPSQLGTYVKGAKKRPLVFRPFDYRGNTDKGITRNKVKQADIQHLPTKWPHHNSTQSLKGFITKLKVRSPEEGRHGISWGELCILFGLRTEATVPDDLGQATAQNNRILPKPFPFKRIVRNVAVATRRIIDATPGGRPHKPIWAARAAPGHRFKPLGSLSSLATIGFTVDLNRQEADHIMLMTLVLHDHETYNGINTLRAGNF